MKYMAKKEIYGAGLSIFYDELSFNEYLKQAEEIRKRYGKGRLPDTSITGEQYYDKIQELVNVAEMIMNKQLLPNLFDLIPLKKDGTFKKDARIYIFENGIQACAPDMAREYISGTRVALAIVPYGVNPWYELMDITEVTNERRARLAITTISGVRKIYPLLDRNLKIQDIKTNATYIKQSDLKPGRIYKEKSGTEYLFLGGISIVLRDEPCPYLTSKRKHIDGCDYLRVTKKVRDLLDGCDSLDEFLERWAHAKLKTDNTDELRFSTRSRTCLRKFVEEVDNPCPKGWDKVNIVGPNATPGLTEFPMFSMDLKDCYTGIMSRYDIYVEYDDTE